MNVNVFAKKVAHLEGGKNNLSIAQIKEVLKCVNVLTGGVLYSVVKLLKAK